MGGTTSVTNLGNWPTIATGQQTLAAADTAEALNDGTSQAARWQSTASSSPGADVLYELTPQYDGGSIFFSVIWGEDTA